MYKDVYKRQLIYRADTDIRSKNTFTVGTGSLRRRSQIKEIYPQAECMELRGNVTTRIQKLRDGLYDAIILAAAGIERLGICLLYTSKRHSLRRYGMHYQQEDEKRWQLIMQH